MTEKMYDDEGASASVQSFSEKIGKSAMAFLEIILRNGGVMW